MKNVFSRFFSLGILPFLFVFLALAQPLAKIGLLTDFHLNLLSYSMVFGITGLAFNLLLGYGGLLSFGHAAYFAVGAYTVAMTHRYLGIESFEAQLAIALVASLLVAALFGIVATRFTRIFFAIITLALTQVIWASTLKAYWITGGSDGIRVPHMNLLGIPLQETMSRPEYLASVFYYYILVVFVISVTVLWIITHSPFGSALQAIRDNEVRAEFIGIRVRRQRWMAFMISGMFTGLSGALFAVLNGHVTPEIADWIFSGDIVFLTLLGGIRAFDGPLLGSIIFIFVRQYAMGYTIYWRLILGAVLVGLVLAFSKGVMGTIYELIKTKPTPITTPSPASSRR